MQVYPLMCVIDEVFEKKPSVAQQLFLVVDSDASGSVEIGEFMHLFRNVNLVVTKVKKIVVLRSLGVDALEIPSTISASSTSAGAQQDSGCQERLCSNAIGCQTRWRARLPTSSGQPARGIRRRIVDFSSTQRRRRRYLTTQLHHLTTY